MKPAISSKFDGGNIEVLEIGDDSASLKIRPDHASKHFQWFYFRLDECKGRSFQLTIRDVHKASYSEGWHGYKVAYSEDREHWTRVDCRYEENCLHIKATPQSNRVWFAYFAPYSMERHEQLITHAESLGANVKVLGRTLDGRTIDGLQIGNRESKRRCWVIARQHPGETMAEWFVEGMLERLLDEDDPVARELLQTCDFRIVPNMNPDGGYRGHLRTNAAGRNLNREWDKASDEFSPEVKCVLEAMKHDGVSLCVDVHGDETLPYNFIDGAQGVESVPEAIFALQARFEKAYMRANPDFQMEHGYPESAPGTANMSMCTNQVATLGGLAMTLEQPFKDTKDTPHPDGWSPERAKRLGASLLDAIKAVAADLPLVE